ncbi:MAG: hypothetical protein ACI3XH_05435 [Phascolarctobacterium sp.]
MDDKLLVAINKLDTEAEASGNKGLKVVADLLIQYISQYPDNVEKILTNGKTLAKAFEEVKKMAKQEAKGGCCYMAPERVMQMIVDYYDIDAKITYKILAEPASVAEGRLSPATSDIASDVTDEKLQPTPAPKQEVSVSIDLDEFF